MIIKRIFRFALKLFSGCTLLYKTAWYKHLFVAEQGELYPGVAWFRSHNERNYDIVNIGSSAAKWAFDWSTYGIKGMNWAQAPQSLVEDFNLLRNFHSILRKGGYVLLPIMPCSSLGRTPGFYDSLRYVKIDSGEPIEPAFHAEAQRYAQFPILFGKPALKALVRYLLHCERNYTNPNPDLEHNPMNPEQLDADGEGWVEGWKREFSISDFDYPLTPQNQAKREERRKLWREVIDFCTERGYKPVFTILPVTKHLSAYFSDTFKENYIYSFLREIERDVPLLDYSNDKELCEDDLYFNSFFHNKKGRELMTKRVAADLHLPMR